MGVVPVVRASALPVARVETIDRGSPRSRVRARAAENGSRHATSVLTRDGLKTRTWEESALLVEQAGAGLLRSGMRADQVVLSLLPGGHPYPELDVALRAIGAVVLRVSPHATREDLLRELDGVDVRLVVCDVEADLDRLQDLHFPAAQLFALDGGQGWDRLVSLGVERLRMDPDAVERADATVDPAGTAVRLLCPAAGAVSTPSIPGLEDRIPADAAVVLVGDACDPLVSAVHDAHLGVGFELVHVRDSSGLARLVETVRPSVLVVADDQLADVAASMEREIVPAPRRLLPSLGRAAELASLRAWWGSSLRTVLTTGLPDAVHSQLDARGVDVALIEIGDLPPADLPESPPIVMGDASQLPRRSPREPEEAFQLEAAGSLRASGSEGGGAVEAPPSPEESAFVLPSLPLFSGESFLDKLLLARAEQAEA